MWLFFIRQNRILVLLGTLGLITFFAFWSDLPVSDNSEVSVNRYNLTRFSQQFLKTMGKDSSEYPLEYAYSTDNTLRWYVLGKFGKRKASQIWEERTPGSEGWKIRLARPDSAGRSSDSFELLLSPLGQLRKWKHQIPDTAPGSRLTPAEALELAERYLRENKIIEPEKYRCSSRSVVLENRTDHFIHYVRFDSLLRLDQKFEINIQGEQVGGFSQNFIIPSDVVHSFQEQIQIRKRFQEFAVLILMLFFVWLIIEFTNQHRSSHFTLTGLRFLFFLCLTIFFLDSFNGLQSALFERNLLPNFLGKIFDFARHFLLKEDLLFSLLVLLAFLVGREYLREKNQFGNLLSLEAALSNSWISVNVASSFMFGFFLAGVLLGGVTLLLKLMTIFFPIMLNQEIFHISFDKQFPWLTPLFKSLKLSLVWGFGILFFGFQAGEKYFKSKIGAFVLVLAIFIFTGSTAISFYPLHANFIFDFFIGIALILIFLHFDFLTTLIVLSLFNLFIYSLPLLMTTSPFLVLSGFSATIVGFSVLFFAWLGFKSQYRFLLPENPLPAAVQALVQQERLLRETEIARSLQPNLLPQHPPQVPPFDLSGMCLPAREVTGNFFDLIQLDARRVGLILCEISTQGVTAAFKLTLLKGILCTTISENPAPAFVIQKLNKIFTRFFAANHQISIFYGVLDSENLTLTFQNVGQTRVVWFHAATNQFSFLESTAIPFGKVDEIKLALTIKEEKIQLSDDDFLMCFSSGFSKVKNKAGEIFGEERILASGRFSRIFPARQMIMNLVAELENFQQSRTVEEDLIMMIARVQRNYAQDEMVFGFAASE